QLWASPGEALDRRAIDAAWAVNHEHPALIKSLFALSNLLLQKKLHLFAMEGTSYRFPAMALGGGLLSIVYLWGAQARSRAAGLALDTKHNSWFLPFVAVAHTAGVALVSRALPPGADRASANAQLRRAAITLACMAAIGPLVFVGLWPWIWHDTLARLAEYARF